MFVRAVLSYGLLMSFLFLPPASANEYSAKAPVVTKIPSSDPMAHVVALGLGLGVSLTVSVTWKLVHRWTGTFRIIDEGFLGRSTYAGGGDKFGHMYFDFVVNRALYTVYRTYDYPREESIWNAFIFGSIARSTMEMADGFTTFEASYGDLLFNMLGSTSSSLLLINPKIDDTFHMSWSYWPSREIKDGTQEKWSFSTDYSGSVIGLDTSIKGLRTLFGLESPSFVDHFDFGLNYFTRGYRTANSDKHQRYIGMSVSYAMEELAPKNSLLLQETLRSIRIPFTYGGLSYGLDSHRWKLQYGLNYFL